jgi:hypothetical protein
MPLASRGEGGTRSPPFNRSRTLGGSERTLLLWLPEPACFSPQWARNSTSSSFLAEAAKEARVAAEAAWLMQGHRKVAGAARKSRYAHLWPRGATVRPVRSERLYLPEEPFSR